MVAQGTYVSTPTTWNYFNGNSMATPHAMGVAELVASKYPALLSKPTGLKKVVMDSGKKLSATAGKTVTGDMVNARAALFPRVITVSPPSGKTGVAAGSNVVAVFSEELNATTINKETFKLINSGTTASVSAKVSYAITGKQIMEDLNLEAPGTWDELLSFCEKVKASGKVPIALGNATPWVTQLIDYALVPSTVYADNPDFDQEMKAGNATFANSGWRDAMEKYLELNDRGFFNENPLGTSYEQQLQLVANGDAAMAVHVSTSLGQVENYGEPGQYVVLPFPGNEDPDKLWIPAAAGGSFGINAEAENPKGAKELLRVMAEPENMNKSASLQGALPSIPNDQFEIEAALEPMMPFMEEGKTVPFMDQLWPNAEVQQVHFAVVQQLFTGEITIDEALTRMDEAYQKGS